MYHDLLPTIQILIGIILLITLSVVVLARWKKESFDASQRTAEIWKQQAEAANAKIAANTARLAEVTRAMSMMEKRVMMVEVDNERKTRLLHIARQEIEFLEDIVRMAVTAGSGRIDKEHKAKCEERIQEFQRFRRDCYKRQEIWEEKQRVFSTYIDTRNSRPADELPDWDTAIVPNDQDAGEAVTETKPPDC